MAEGAVTRKMFAEILSLIARLRAPHCRHEAPGIICDRRRQQRSALTSAIKIVAAPQRRQPIAEAARGTGRGPRLLPRTQKTETMVFVRGGIREVLA